ncbi:MAG: NAD(P)-dependent oxidoreductase [Verrucomicrobiaceae bacterium]|nr:NAD(P)-dependent oxidoreductase [Verrucomicrobiaceae bacterium]
MGSKKIKKVGVLGLGIIGSRVSENLRKAGFDVFVWSRSARATPGFLASPAEVADVSQVVQIFVRDDAALAEAMESMSRCLREDHVIMNHSTVSPAATRAAAAVCEKAGAGFLDAPFTGSKNAAAAGKIVYYIGGDEALVERARPVLEASAMKIMPLGRVGDATVLKIATNLITAATVEALAEAAAITRASGIPTESLLAALEPNANFSTLIGMKLPTMISGDYEPHFSVVNMLKDVRFAREMAREAELQTPVLDGTMTELTRALEAGKGDKDFSVIAEDFTGRSKTVR